MRKIKVKDGDADMKKFTISSNEARCLAQKLLKAADESEDHQFIQSATTFGIDMDTLTLMVKPYSLNEEAL